MNKFIAVLFCGMLFLMCGSFTQSAMADSVLSHAPYYTGHMELRIPAWNSQSGYISTTESTEMAGDLRVYNILPLKTVFWASGVHTFHAAGIFKAENKLNVGVEVPIPGSSFSFISYWDRRFDVNVDRVFVGVRTSFRGGL